MDFFWKKNNVEKKMVATIREHCITRKYSYVREFAGYWNILAILESLIYLYTQKSKGSGASVLQGILEIVLFSDSFENIIKILLIMAPSAVLLRYAHRYENTGDDNAIFKRIYPIVYAFLFLRAMFFWMEPFVENNGMDIRYFMKNLEMLKRSLSFGFERLLSGGYITMINRMVSIVPIVLCLVAIIYGLIVRGKKRNPFVWIYNVVIKIGYLGLTVYTIMESAEMLKYYPRSGVIVLCVIKCIIWINMILVYHRLQLFSYRKNVAIYGFLTSALLKKHEDKLSPDQAIEKLKSSFAKGLITQKEYHDEVNRICKVCKSSN